MIFIEIVHIDIVQIERVSIYCTHCSKLYKIMIARNELNAYESLLKHTGTNTLAAASGTK